MKHRLYRLILISVLCGTILVPNAFARSTLKCWLIGAGEFLVPGLGYVIMQDWDKAIVFGGLRRVALNNARNNFEGREFEEDPRRVYRTREVDGEDHLDIYMNRQTFYGQVSSGIFNNLSYASIYDLYSGSCEENSSTYSKFLSPYRIDQFGTRPSFWIPIGLLAGTGDFGANTTYHLDNLSRDEMVLWSFVGQQLTGVGEEMLFRGVIQRSIFEWFHTWMSEPKARWFGIVAGATIFGSAHNGQGLSASPFAAFVAGMYFGWLYHPAPGQFELHQSIALHSWWNTVIINQTLVKSRVKNQQVAQDVTIPLFMWNGYF